MAEKLTAFSGSNWTNFGAYSYVFSGGNADAVSGVDHSSACTHKARKYFTISGDVQTAVLNLSIWWDLYHTSNVSGSAEFTVYLRQPDDSLVELASHSEDADSADNSGSLDICDSLDVSSYMTETGTYSIEIWCTVSSGWYVPIDEPVYLQSSGQWDGPPSLLVTERFTKTVAEAVGGGEVQDKQANLALLEGAGLGESYFTIPTGTGEALKFEKSGLQEFLLASVAVARAEGAGLGETLTRTYGYRQRDVPGIPDGAGLGESLVARWEAGNYTSERDILAEADIWEDIAPPVTEWESV